MSSHLDAYFARAGRVPRLTAEQEVELGRRIRAGDESARQRMIEANLLLVPYVAKKYLWRGLPLEDLVSAGNAGLIVAVDKFDPERGVKFSTHAVWWIRHAVSRVVEREARTVRLPAIQDAEVRRMYGAARELPSPTPSAVAERADLPVAVVRSLWPHLFGSASLSAPVDDEDSATLGDLLADAGPAPDVAVAERDALRRLAAALDTLTEPQRVVLAALYGLDDGEPRSHWMAAQRLGLPVRQVRAIEDQALFVLRDLLSSSLFAEAS